MSKLFRISIFAIFIFVFFLTKLHSEVKQVYAADNCESRNVGISFITPYDNKEAPNIIIATDQSFSIIVRIPEKELAESKGYYQVWINSAGITDATFGNNVGKSTALDASKNFTSQNINGISYKVFKFDFSSVDRAWFSGPENSSLYIRLYWAETLTTFGNAGGWFGSNTKEICDTPKGKIVTISAPFNEVGECQLLIPDNINRDTSKVTGTIPTLRPIKNITYVYVIYEGDVKAKLPTKDKPGKTGLTEYNPLNGVTKIKEKNISSGSNIKLPEYDDIIKNKYTAVVYAAFEVPLSNLGNYSFNGRPIYACGSKVFTVSGDATTAQPSPQTRAKQCMITPTSPVSGQQLIMDIVQIPSGISLLRADLVQGSNIEKKESKNITGGQTEVTLALGVAVSGSFTANVYDQNNNLFCSDTINVPQKIGEGTAISLQNCKEKNNCTQSTGKTCEKGVETALGCIPTEPRAFIDAILRFVAGISGGIALMLMALGAFQMISSAGNAETLKKGQEQFTAAIIGLLFVIFSTLLLQIIGVDLLGIFPK